MMKDIDQWHVIGDKLTGYLGICSCQRKLKSIIDCLVRIYYKNQEVREPMTGDESLICALLDARGLIMHGTNCEYPFIFNSNPFWSWVLEIQNHPALEDN